MTQKLEQNQIRHLIGLCSSGRIEQSLHEANLLVKNHSNSSVLHTIIGGCYYSLGQADGAVESYQQAIKLEPNNAKSHYNLGNAFRLANQLNAAVSSYQRTVMIQPDDVNGHYFLGYTLWQLGQLPAALDSFQRTLELKPDYAEALNIRGYTLSQLGQTEAAIKHIKQALKLKPNYAEAHNNLGSALKDLGQTAEAKASYQRAINYNPNFAEAHNNLGNLFNELGYRDDSIKSYQRALEINPNYTKAHSNLSALKKYQSGDTQLAEMEKLYAHPQLPSSDRSKLCFSLAKAYDDLANIDKSFAFLVEGNRLRKQELNYKQDNDKQLFSQIKKHFSQTNKPFDVIKNDKPSSIRPIFIVGMPRSGTSLVEQILASHSQVHGAGELGFMEKFLMPRLSTGFDLTSNKTTALLSAQDMQKLRNVYLKSITSLQIEETIITDKMPLNFRWIGFILSIFPQAKIINLSRNPIATCWSNFKLDFQSTGLGFAYDLKDLTLFYKLYTDLMSFWHTQFPNKIYNLCYEQLTENQQEETGKLLEYCELDWEQSCLDYHTTKRSVKTASTAQVRQKIYKGSSAAWHKYDEHLKPLREALE